MTVSALKQRLLSSQLLTTHSMPFTKSPSLSRFLVRCNRKPLRISTRLGTGRRSSFNCPLSVKLSEFASRSPGRSTINRLLPTNQHSLRYRSPSALRVVCKLQSLSCRPCSGRAVADRARWAGRRGSKLCGHAESDCDHFASAQPSATCPACAAARRHPRANIHRSETLPSVSSNCCPWHSCLRYLAAEQHWQPPRVVPKPDDTLEVVLGQLWELVHNDQCVTIDNGQRILFFLVQSERPMTRLHLACRKREEDVAALRFHVAYQFLGPSGLAAAWRS